MKKMFTTAHFILLRYGRVSSSSLSNYNSSLDVDHSNAPLKPLFSSNEGPATFANVTLSARRPIVHYAYLIAVSTQVFICSNG